MKILGNRVLLKTLTQETHSPGGIEIPLAHRPEQQIHEVVAVGNGRRLKSGERLPIELAPGDRVLLDQYSLNDRTQAGDGLWIVNVDACSIAVPGAA